MKFTIFVHILIISIQKVFERCRDYLSNVSNWLLAKSVFFLELLKWNMQRMLCRKLWQQVHLEKFTLQLHVLRWTHMLLMVFIARWTHLLRNTSFDHVTTSVNNNDVNNNNNDITSTSVLPVVKLTFHKLTSETFYININFFIVLVNVRNDLHGWHHSPCINPVGLVKVFGVRRALIP